MTRVHDAQGRPRLVASPPAPHTQAAHLLASGVVIRGVVRPLQGDDRSGAFVYSKPS